MIFFNINIEDKKVLTTLTNGDEIVYNSSKPCASVFLDIWDAYRVMSSSIQEGLSKVGEIDEFNMYITIESWFALSDENKDKWNKGLFGSFPDVNNITILPISQSSLYYTDSSFENRVSLIIGRRTVGWSKTQIGQKPILGFGFLVDGDPLSTYDIGGTVISFILSSKSKKLEEVLLKEFNSSDKASLLNKIYENYVDGRKFVSALGKRKFLDKLKAEMNEEQVQAFAKILRYKIDNFVFWLYRDIESILTRGRISFSIIGEVFYDSEPLLNYFKEKVTEIFQEKIGGEIKFEDASKDMTKATEMMIKELKWDV